MNAVWLSFKQMMRFVRYDMMQVVAAVTPLMMGFLFRYGVPVLERYLTAYYDKPYILAPYYGLFDIFFSFMLPVMYCYIASMVILEDKDDHVLNYLAVTPLGKGGYIISRLVIPTVISFVMTAVFLPIFNLSNLSFATIIMLSLSGALQGLISTLLVVALSSNKLEGLAVTKMSSLIMLGVFAPYFINSNAQYMLSFLPSYWIAKGVYDGRLIYIAVSFAVSAVWIAFLEKRYEVKSNS